MVNHMILQGRLVADPELKSTQSGVSLCSFRVAWSEKRKSIGGNETETKLFMNCTAWRGLGEMVSKHFTKGKEIIVEGRLQSRNYTDKNGQERTAIDMNVTDVSFCGPKDGNASGSSYWPSTAPVNVNADDFTEMGEDGEPLPF
jgi:single-strand DNA-binding protein